jgi:RNA polymerase sigma-70 factor (family 1)
MQPLDEREFTKFFNEHYTKLVFYAYRITDNQAAAEDIAEDAFVNYWKKNDSQAVIKSPKSYLYTAARNASISWIKEHQSKVTRDSKAAGLNNEFDKTPLECMIFAETMELMYAALEKLPGQCKRVCLMHYVEGKTVREIAEELGISVGTVNTHKYRGIALLQKLMKGMPMVLIIELLKVTAINA